MCVVISPQSITGLIKEVAGGQKDEHVLEYMFDGVLVQHYVHLRLELRRSATTVSLHW